jgi:2-dehydro-3-deoxy-D-arabinonate dehydratase
MKLYRTPEGPLVVREGRCHALEESWDSLIARDDLAAHLARTVAARRASAAGSIDDAENLPLVESQEVWAAGVTYFRSRDARMEESRAAGGGSFYDRVYDADRPELFLKATGLRVAGTGQKVRIRGDSRWNVPEPELTLVVGSGGRISGYTIGNDMSSRDIEGENPLYLPQAKVYDGSCALGPCILVTEEPLPADTRISIEVRRSRAVAFQGSTTLAEMKRKPEELVEYLYRECSFPHGCFLMTGTGIIPPSSFSLASGDEIRITIDPIGTLVNEVM